MKLEQYFESNTKYYRNPETDVRYKRTTRYGKSGDVIEVAWYTCDEELDEWIRVLHFERQELEEALTTDEKWYIIVGDDSGHEYVIPADKGREWYAWLEDEEASSYGPFPEYAKTVEGIEFREWRHS